MDDASANRGLARGQLVAGYKLRQQLGEGAFGLLYAAIHPLSGRRVALRLLHPWLSARPAACLEAVQRLMACRHAGIVPVLGGGQSEAGDVYMLGEFVHGQPLSDFLSLITPLTLSETSDLLAPVTEALTAAHERGVVHGHLSPANLWLRPGAEGRWPPTVRVADFGLELLRQASGSHLPLGWQERLASYAAPEQIRGEEAGPAADLYALGVITYQLLTGRLPFSSEQPAEVLRMHLEQSPPPPGAFAALEPESEELLLRALAKAPAQRHGSAREFSAQLAALAQHVQAVACSETRASSAGEAPGSDSLPLVVAEQVPEAGPRPLVVAGRQVPALQGAWVKTVCAAGLAIVAALVLTAVAYWGFAGDWLFLGAGVEQSPSGHLVVHTEPPGASVSLDGVRQPSLTPLTLDGLIPGRTYALQVHLAEHLPWSEKLALGLGEEERQLTIVLRRSQLRFGSLQLHSDVPADFYFDARKVGTAVRELTLADVLADEDHFLRVVAPGYAAVKQTVRAAPGKIQILRFEFSSVGAAGSPARPGEHLRK